MKMQRFRHLAVGLSRTESDAQLIRYAAMICSLGVVQEVRFVHVLPQAGEAAASRDHGGVQAELREAVQAAFAGTKPSVSLSCDVLDGPLTDRLLAYVAEQQIDLLLVGHRRDHSGRRALARRLAM